MNLKILAFFSLLLCCNGLSAQFGVQIVAGSNLFTDDVKSPEFIPSNSIHYSIGPSYWLRLKKRRIEFNPSLGVDYSKSDLDYRLNSNSSLQELSVILNVPILFYPLDFNNDCNCPTFNKGGQFFEKGFYFIFNPATYYSTKKIGSSSLSTEQFGFQAGIGAGIDIGLSRKSTISPAIVFSKMFNDKYINHILQPYLLTGNKRYRIDLMVRLIWFAKKKR